MYGRCTGASVWLANYFLKIKILTALTLTCTAEPRPHPPCCAAQVSGRSLYAALHKLVGAHFTMQVSGRSLHVALHNARCLAGRPARPARPARPPASTATKKYAFCEVSTNFSVFIFFGTWPGGRVAGWPDRLCALCALFTPS